MFANTSGRALKCALWKYFRETARFTQGKCYLGSSAWFRRSKKDDFNLSSLFKPVSIKANPDDINIGAELTGTLDKGELVKVLNKFSNQREIRTLCMENGLDRK